MQFWLGVSPIVFILSAVTAAYAYAAMPVPRTGDEVLQLWLQVHLLLPVCADAKAGLRAWFACHLHSQLA